MKYLIIIALCAFLVVEATSPPPSRGTRPPRPTRGTRPPRPTRGTRPPRPTRPPGCDTAEDCEADHCCIEKGTFFFKKGKCVKLASEGMRCRPEESAMKGKYNAHCPCAEGLSCEPKRTVKTRNGILRINDRCVKPGSSTVQPDGQTTDPEPTDSGESNESEE